MTTANDRAVLEAIFSPFSVTIDGATGENIKKDEKIEEIEPTGGQVQEAHQLELEGVKEAENGNLIEAIELFTQSINLVPSLASAYNNRAQAHRLNAAPEAAMRDLNKAIRLSHGHGTVASQAFCQRGLLFERLGQREDALKDFQSACNLGSGFAKSALVQLNPYAALCNQMLTEMFTKLNDQRP